MGKGRKLKQIVLCFKRVFTRCFPCCGSLTQDDGSPYSKTAVNDKSLFNESSTFYQRINIPMTAESLADPDLFHYSQILQAGFNQLHAPSKYAGNQCTSVALYTLVMRNSKQFSTWDKDTMDDVLLKGTNLHGFFRDGLELTNHPDMRVSLFDLPEHVPVFVGDTCFVARGTDAMVFGQVAREMDDAASLGEEFPKLYHYLQNVLSQERSVLVTVGEYTVAVAMEACRIWLFDSHSRDERGMPEGDFMTGKACLLAFANVDSLVAHLVSVYGHDQYCARSFTFYNLADDPVSPENSPGQAGVFDEAEKSNQMQEDENSNQNAHTSASLEPGFVIIGGKPSICNKEELVDPAGLSPQTGASSPHQFHLLSHENSGAVHWKTVQTSEQPHQSLLSPCILALEQWYLNWNAFQISEHPHQSLLTPCILTREQWCHTLEGSSNIHAATATHTVPFLHVTVC